MLTSSSNLKYEKSVFKIQVCAGKKWNFIGLPDIKCKINMLAEISDIFTIVNKQSIVSSYPIFLISSEF